MNNKFKLFSIILVLVLSTLACGLPDLIASNQEGQNTDSLSTSVAATLAAFDQVGPVVEATQEASVGNTPEAVPPTATTEPTITPTETQEPTPTVSPTTPPDDPKLSLGDADFTELFNSATNWAEHDEAATKVEIKDGRLYYTMHNASPYTDRWTFSWPEIQDFYLEVTAITPAACSGKDRYGVIFRAPNYSQGYLFFLACDGTYKLSKWDGSNMVTLEDWTYSGHIDAGPNKANRLGIETTDNDISLYVNGKFLVLVEDNDYVNEGYFGFTLNAAETPGFTVMFDELRYWE